MEQTINTLDRRVTNLERAVIGTLQEPGIAEMQRNQNREIAALRATLESVSDNVQNLAEARQTEVMLQEGEQRAFRRFRQVAYAALAFLATGGSLLGGQILAALRELAK